MSSSKLDNRVLIDLHKDGRQIGHNYVRTLVIIPCKNVDTGATSIIGSLSIHSISYSQMALP